MEIPCRKIHKRFYFAGASIPSAFINQNNAGGCATWQEASNFCEAKGFSIIEDKDENSCIPTIDPYGRHWEP